MDGDLYFSDLLADDPDMAPLVEQFVAELVGNREALEAAAAADDAPALTVLAHQYKGSGGGYGFPDLSAAAAELESVARRDGAVTSEVRRSLARFLDVAARVRAGEPG